MKGRVSPRTDSAHVRRKTDFITTFRWDCKQNCLGSPRQEVLSSVRGQTVIINFGEG